MIKARQLTRGAAYGKAGVAVAILAAGAVQAAQDFHPAATPAELGLKHVLDVDSADGRVLDNLLGRAPVPKAKRVDYFLLLTPQLLAALHKTEKDMVQHDCGGRYVKGDICGMDFDPLSCSQYGPNGWRFSTQSAGPTGVVIQAHGREEPKRIMLYRMKQVGSGWKLDAIRCDDGYSFNWG